MSKLKSKDNRVSDQSRLQYRLREANLKIERSMWVPEGTKKCLNNNNRQSPCAFNGNYSVSGGDGLLIFDIDVPVSDRPDWIQELPETFRVKTVHDAEHRYFAVPENANISNTKADWGSIRYTNWKAVGPGSSVNHDEFCEDDCSKNGTSTYEISNDEDIVELTGEILSKIQNISTDPDQRGGGQSSTASGSEYNWFESIPSDTEYAEEGLEFINTTLVEKATSFARDALYDLLKGGTGPYDMTREDSEKIDRDVADYYALLFLFGTFKQEWKSTKMARKYAIETFKLYCEENKYDKTGNPRKWLVLGDRYLHDSVMDDVVDDYDRNIWLRWSRKSSEDGFDIDEDEPWKDPGQDGVPSQIEQDTVMAAIHILAGGVSIEEAVDIYNLSLQEGPKFPPINTPLSGGTGEDLIAVTDGDSRRSATAKEIVTLCDAINPERKSSYHDWTLKHYLQKVEGLVAMAKCWDRENGERYRYYPAGFDDLDDADTVTSGGIEYDAPGERYSEKDSDDPTDIDQSDIEELATDEDEYEEQVISEDTTEDDESDEDGNPGYPEGEPVSEEEQLLLELEDAPPHAAKRRIRERA